MNLRMVGVVLAKELRDLFRDRRTILAMIVIPVLSIPLLMSGAVWLAKNSVEKMRSSETYVVVRGAEQAAGLLEPLKQGESRFTFLPDPDPGKTPVQLLETDSLAIVLEYGPGLAGALERLARPADTSRAPAVRLHFDGTDDAAKDAGDELMARLGALRDVQLQGWLLQRGLRPDLAKPFEVEHIETAPPKRQAADMLARFLPYIILLLCISGAMYPAMDLTAGEKERSTIETLLVNPVSRLDLVLGKYLATSLMALGSAAFTLGGQYLYFKLAADTLLEGKLDISLDGASLGFALLMILPVALTFSAAMIAICLYARSMKEAQSYMGPLMTLVVFPSMASMIPGLELNAGLAFVPVFNVTLVIRDILQQDYGQLGMMALVLAVNVGYAALSLWAAVRMFQREEVIFRS